MTATLVERRDEFAGEVQDLIPEVRSTMEAEYLCLAYRTARLLDRSCTTVTNPQTRQDQRTGSMISGGQLRRI
jgi:hypothetical protein